MSTPLSVTDERTMTVPCTKLQSKSKSSSFVSTLNCFSTKHETSRLRKVAIEKLYTKCEFDLSNLSLQHLWSINNNNCGLKTPEIQGRLMKPEMEIEKDVVIVGGGIAGLATALALKRVGIQSLVLERSSSLRATGTALTLGQNAWVALDALGVADKLTSIYTPFHKGIFVNIKNGARQEVTLTGTDGNMPGLRTVHRSVLLEALAHELPVDTIRFSSKLRSIGTIRPENSSVTVLTLEDGTTIHAKVVIGCDGVNSVVARWLGLKSPIHSGRFAVRGLSVYDQGHGLKHEFQQFVDGANRAGIVPLNDKELYWFCAATKDDMERESPEMIQKSVLKNTADYPAIFSDVVQHSDLSTLTWDSLKFRVPWDLLLKDMYKNNVTVAGDAMHAMTPDLGQGACSSLEDAVVLGRHIGNSYIANGKIDSRALKGYTKERRWRAAMLISGSYISGWVQQGGSGWLKVFLRDQVFYKYFPLLTRNIAYFNCGQLPSVCNTSQENTGKKTD